MPLNPSGIWHFDFAIKVDFVERKIDRTTRDFASQNTRGTVTGFRQLHTTLYGTYRARTYDPLLVRQMLSQLS